MSVCLSVSLFVRLFVGWITQKVMNGFWCNFVEGFGPGRNQLVFGADL